MIRAVRLNQLPNGVCFPPELINKISYDSQSQQLRFEGFMSKTDFDKLLGLTNDLAYQRSLEQLFQKCTFSSGPEVSEATRPIPQKWAAAAALLIVVSCTGAWLGIRKSPPVPSEPSRPLIVQTVPAESTNQPVVVEAVDRATYTVAIGASANSLDQGATPEESP